MNNKKSITEYLDFRTAMVLLLLFSFSLGQVYRHLLVILAIIGIILCIRHIKTLKYEPAIQLLILLFICLWIPMLISLIDAEYLKRSASVTARFLMFPLAGSVILYWILRPDMANKLLWGTMFIVLFWTIDGLIQFAWNHDIFGNPLYTDGRLTGTFSSWPHLGVILAIFLPVYLESLYQLSLKSRWSWLLILPVLSVILLGGGRSSWMLTIVALFSYFIYFQRAGRSFSWRRGILLGVITTVLAAAIIWNVDWLSQRVNNTLGIFSGEYKLIDKATSKRPPVWQTALNMSSEHWLNGVGPRTFQLFYKEYTTAPDDPFINAPAGHPHLFILEVAAETGLLGLMGYIVFATILIRQIKSTLNSRHSDAAPWGLAACVAAFPLSSTMSFYAYFSSCLIWMLLIIYIALSIPLRPPTQHAIEGSKNYVETANN